MRTVLGYIGFAVWSVFCILCSVVAFILTRSKETPLTMARTWWAPGSLYCLGVKKLTITGLENIPANESVIIVSNHSSYIDIPAIFSAMPYNVRFVAKSSLKAMPFLGWYMTMTDMVFIDRGNKKKAMDSLQKAGEMIHKGKPVIIFPEGTRTKTGKLGELKKGAFHLANSANVAILPIGIKGSFAIWSSLSMKLTPGNVELHIGKPITSDADIDKIMAAVKTSIEQLVH
jgi:1-acyl-sn-glycerol-3-phosphate acyltransferase